MATDSDQTQTIKIIDGFGGLTVVSDLETIPPCDDLPSAEAREWAVEEEDKDL